MEICKIEDCTGCSLCATICSQNAITMLSDNRGFIYPEIDAQKCINCGKCRATCPVQNIVQGSTINQSVYAAWNRDATVRRNSSSGGIFTLLAESVIDDGGIVFGAKWNSDFHAEHCAITQKEDIHLLNGSKYMQSIVQHTYVQVSKYLSDGKKVLFSGTPCQIHALKQYIGKENKNLILIDLVCHGVPSAQIFDRHLDELTQHNSTSVRSINLRYKKPSWSYGSVRIEYEESSLYIKSTVKDAYFNLFNFNYSIRDCCHNCKYANQNRVGDLTLADFWGYIPDNHSMLNFEKGVSCVIVNSEKGAYLLSQVERNIVFEAHSMESAKCGNQCLTMPFDAPPDCNFFWSDYVNGMSIGELNKKYITHPYQIPKFLSLRIFKQKCLWCVKRMLHRGE